jgi:transposase
VRAPRSRPNATKRPWPARSGAYANRNRVERLWGRLEEWRAVATRYEKTARSFMGVLCLAASRDWLRR